MRFCKRALMKWLFSIAAHFIVQRYNYFVNYKKTLLSLYKYYLSLQSNF